MTEMEPNDNMSLPEEFLKKMESLLGDEFPAFLASYASGRYFGLRLNPLKCKEREPAFVSGLSKIPWAEEGYYYEADQRPGRHPFHEAGVYYIQEPSAMAVVEALAPKPGEKILDLCAAPGGKTTHIAGKLMGQGLLVCNEIHPARAKILSQNVERMGVTNALVLNSEPDRLRPFFAEFFDGIVVDAPCSGEGMFRKDVNARAEWSPDHVKLCAARQDAILEQAAAMLRPGGRLVYSTCTFSPEENEGAIARFLESHPEFTVRRPAVASHFSPGRPEWANGRTELSDTVHIWPHLAKGEGHFLALLEKTGGAPKIEDKEDGASDSRGGRKSVLPEFETFCRDTFTDPAAFSGARVKISYGDQLYLLPEGIRTIDGLRVLRPGLHLGTMKKNRFEPSHALALSLSPPAVLRSIELGTEEMALRYLGGEAIRLCDVPAWPAQEKTKKGSNESGREDANGWTLVTTGGYSLGWGKRTGETLKNHYPKGLRRM